MKKRCGKAFTLIELIIVILILGILAIIAIPRFTSYKDATEKAVEEATIRIVQSGITTANAVEEVKQ